MGFFSQENFKVKSEGCLIPDRYMLIVEKSQVVIIKVPKIPLLYTLKEKEGHRLFFTEDEFCQWIDDLAFRAKLPEALNFDEERSKFSEAQNRHERVSVGSSSLLL
jgi:hypothetical protein